MRDQEGRFGARTDRGGSSAVGVGRVMAALAARSVERHDVHERRVRAGHQGDQGDQYDGHVLGHGPPAHALVAATRRSAAAPPPLRLPLHRLQVRVIVHRVVVTVKVQVVIRVGHRVVRFLAVLVAVVPERGQMDYGRAHQSQYREEHRSDERDERRKVRYQGSDKHCEHNNIILSNHVV